MRTSTLHKRLVHLRLASFILLAILLFACQTTTAASTITTDPTGWDGESVVYDAETIATFGSGTPAGTAHYDAERDAAVIWNVDASLDNYGGIQTPTLSLDFSKAVTFRLDVSASYAQYIVKLAVEGESEYFYVLSDSGATGVISVNVVDAMLGSKYRAKNTQPDPGYANGWKYDGTVKNCAFHILAKGPDGERQTAELVVNGIAIYNNQPAVTEISITSDALEDGVLERLKGAAGVQLAASILPQGIADAAILWSTLDAAIATVDADGFVAFTGVGTTQVVATAAIDQSKTAAVTVNVTSGYENPVQLAARLGELAYGGSSADAAAFSDLFATTWGDDIGQTFTIAAKGALASRIAGAAAVIENYFDPALPADVDEAAGSLAGGKASTDLVLSGTGGATVYRAVNGSLFEERYDGGVAVAYATYDDAWSKSATYAEQAIVVWDDGTVRKYQIDVLAATLLGAYDAANLADGAKWLVPDRTMQADDPVAHALSPATVALAGGLAVIRQDKYPEAKYCFGGLVSGIFTVPAGKTVELILDVADLNQQNDYVRTMWEIKILYYQSPTGPVVSANPLKVASGNTTGIQTISFTPAYPHFRIYLVVNGSDIGAQFADATMSIRSLKLYVLD